MQKVKAFHKQGKGKKSPRFLVKCRCGCKNKLEIYYDDYGLEIAGVDGSLEEWRDILLSILKAKEYYNLNKL